MYYESNSSYVYVEEFNASALTNWLNDSPPKGPKLSTAPIKVILSEPEGKVRWGNLLEWLRSY